MTATSVGLRLTVGPPASGKTTKMVAVARGAGADGRRVWWLALPHQRASVFRRVTSGGIAMLGLEVMSAQQAYYRVLSALEPAGLLPLLVGTARIVSVAEALRVVTGRTPSPGEAKLFAAAIAEAKRYELDPEALAGSATDTETQRLAAVFREYEEAGSGSWDYDDVRSAAAALVLGGSASGVIEDPAARAAAGLPDVVIVDGWRELGPLDWLFLRGLARHVEVHVTLPEAPPGTEPDETLAPRAAGAAVERYGAVNPVEEARWVLRSLKRDLGSGIDALELAVVAPRGVGDALLAIADEYGVPLMDERGSALADSPAGRTLLDLLELPESPTPVRLLAVPELAPIARVALRLGVTGGDALARVANGLGMSERLTQWTARLAVTDDPVEWTRALLSEVLTLTQPELPSGFEERVLAAAQHAARLEGGAGFRVWLAALLRDVRSPSNVRGGVALLTADLASGRRFTRCYVMGATVGAYGAGEREDYFIPDERRNPVPEVGKLPRRFAGGDALAIAELLTRGATTVLTAAAAGTDGKLVPDERLMGDPAELAPLPELPAGSRLELRDADVYMPGFDLADKGVDGGASWPERPDAEWLRSYGQRCAFRAWGEKAILPNHGHDETSDRAEGVERELGLLLDPPLPDEAEWYHLVRALKGEAALTSDRLEEVATRFPWAADWLGRHRTRLLDMTWGPAMIDTRLDVRVSLDAGSRERRGGRASVYRFVEPPPPDWGGEKSDWHWALRGQRDRWAEYLAADMLLNHPRQAPRHVEIVVWPVLGDPITVERSSNKYLTARIEAVRQAARDAVLRFRDRDVYPTPGYWCGDCKLFYVCRMGLRE